MNNSTEYDSHKPWVANTNTLKVILLFLCQGQQILTAKMDPSVIPHSKIITGPRPNSITQDGAPGSTLERISHNN